MEKYRINSANSFYLALSEVYPMFCRVEEKYSGYDSRLGSVSEGSSILKVDENGKRRIDNECPVIAYGFSAFLLAHSVKDGSEAGFLWQGDWTSARNLREVYFNKAFAKHKEDNRRKYMAADGDECIIAEFDSRFLGEHLSKEKEFLGNTESLDKGLADGLWQVVRVEVEKYLVEVEERITASEGKKKEPIKSKGRYSEYLCKLFHGNISLIDELVGLDDDNVAKKIKKWATEKDKIGRPLIENPANGLRLKFAEELKKNKLIKKSVDSFRRKI